MPALRQKLTTHPSAIRHHTLTHSRSRPTTRIPSQQTIPVTTRQTTARAIAAETARYVRDLATHHIAPGSAIEYMAHHRAAVRHELGPDASTADVVETLIQRYNDDHPELLESDSEDEANPLTTFAVGYTVKITRGLHSIGQFAPDDCVGSILEINAEADTADILIAGTIANVVPLAWLEHRPDSTTTLANHVGALIHRLQMHAPA